MRKKIGTIFLSGFITEISLFSPILPETISREETRANRPTKDNKPILLQIRVFLQEWLKWRSNMPVLRLTCYTNICTFYQQYTYRVRIIQAMVGVMRMF